MGWEWEGMGIPSWEWYGFGNKSQNWEWEWEGMGMDCMGMGGSGNMKSHSRSSLIKTPERIGMQFTTIHYVLEISPQNKFGDDWISGGLWVNM